MQNLKFRAWDKENKEWLYFVITPRKEDIESTISFGSRIHTYLRTSGRIEDKYYQYIGTEDKNGKEIYEGDILKTKRGEIKVVKFLFPSFYLAPSIEERVGVDNFDMLDTSEEIIGDIINNAKLLE